MKKETKGHGHGHNWIVGFIGVIVSVLIYKYFSANEKISGMISLSVWGHFTLAGIILISVYLALPQKLKYSLFEKHQMKKLEGKLYFGWSYGGLNLFPAIGIVLLSGAVFSYFLNPFQIWLPLIFLLISINLFLGNIVIRNSKKLDHMTLPYVNLLRTDNDLILDAGCGSGRTTIALSKVMKNSRIVAFDRFDSDYIDNGGIDLIQKNIEITGLSDKVEIVKGDITEMKFINNYFDSAISTYMMDHLGKHKLEGLREIRRVLKPGGKFLLVVFVPNWATFSVFNILSFSLSSRKKWRQLFVRAGFRLKEEGAINAGVYFLIEKIG